MKVDAGEVGRENESRYELQHTSSDYHSWFVETTMRGDC